MVAVDMLESTIGSMKLTRDLEHVLTTRYRLSNNDNKCNYIDDDDDDDDCDVDDLSHIMIKMIS